MLRKTAENLNKWRDIPYSWIERLSVVNISVLYDLIYRFNEISIKIPASYFVDVYKTASKVHMEKQKIQNIQHNFEGEKQSCGTDITDIKTYYKAIFLNLMI